MTLEGIDNVEDFVEQLDRVEPPGQLISFLTDPLLQKYVMLKPSPMATDRINLWLATCLEDQYNAQQKGTGDPSDLTEILEGLLRHAQYTKVRMPQLCPNMYVADTPLKTLHPTVLVFLKEYLSIWNGQDDIDILFGLLSYIAIDSFADIYSSYLSIVERALVIQGIPAYAKLIDLYTSLFQHEASAASSVTTRRIASRHRVLQDLAAHASALSISLLLSSRFDSGSGLTSSILRFYELLSTCSMPHIIPIILPPLRLVYLLTQNASSATLSRVCGIIGSYKVAFDQHPKPVKDYYPAATTETLNICLRDMYNLLWVTRALHVADQKSIGLYCDPTLRSTLNDYLGSLDREYTIGSAFGLSHHNLLASLSAVAWRSIEEQEIEREKYDKYGIRYHQGPVSQRSLHLLRREGGVNVEWDGAEGYKVTVLNWLAERGLVGMRSLMFVTVTDLKNSV